MRYFFLFLLLIIANQLYPQVTYHADIEPILSEKCISCHQKGEIGPIPLTTYNEVASYASMIRFVTENKLMPPFKADHIKNNFANERSISKEEIDKINAWIKNGLKKGKRLNKSTKKNPPKKILYDKTICMSESFEHYGIYYDEYQAFVLPIDLEGHRFIKDIKFEPGNKKIVKSANISVAKIKSSKEKDEWDPRYGFFAFGSLGFSTTFPSWYVWSPNTKNRYHESQAGFFLPENSEFILHLHYRPSGTKEKDSSCIHLMFEDKANPIFQNIPLIKTDYLVDTFKIKANEKTRITSTFILPEKSLLHSITPLAHLLCRSWNVYAVLPNKKSIQLIDIPDWDFHWKDKYIFDQNIELPAGTRIYATAIYDNTSDNPYNPSEPPRTMLAGPNMYDENFECYFEFAPLSLDKGHINKPYLMPDSKVTELQFYLPKADSVKIIFHNLENNSHFVLGPKSYTAGSHTIQSSLLPRSPGRYCISMRRKNQLVDCWWLTITN